MAQQIEPVRVAVTIGKKLSKNFQTYEVTITEEWTMTAPVEGAMPGESATAEAAVDRLRKTIAQRIKKAVNEELGVQFTNDVLQ